MLTAEQQCLLDRAQYTWNRRREAKAAGMPFGEESVTETILLDLKLSYPGEIWIVPFNKRQEGKIGADWEWCFASEGEQSFLPMLVQAKVLNDQEQSYDHIARTVGNTGIRQIDRLLDTAESRGVPAAYAFYNYLADTGRLTHSCQSLAPSDSQSEPWGISIAEAQRVKNALPDQTFDTIVQFSMPLHCLLCSQGRAELPEGGSPAVICMSMSRTSKHIADDAWRPRKERPNYYNSVKELMSDNVEIDSKFDYRAAIREKLAASNPGIDGIVILRDGRRRAKLE